MQAAHHLNIQGLEGVTGRLNKVNAGVDSVVDDVAAVNLIFGLQVGIETLLDVLNDGAPRIVVVHKITETGGVNNAQTQTDTILLDISAGRLDRDGLGDDIGIGARALLGRIERGVEQGVDESRLSEARFT